MPPLSIIPLPLQAGGPPSGYGWEECDLSSISATTAFHAGINQRDRLLGDPRCVVCGEGESTSEQLVQDCHIIPKVETDMWKKLRKCGWISLCAKVNPEHEPRNGLCLCPNHHIAFDHYRFFIRYNSDIRKMIFINYSDQASLRLFHGKAVAIDMNHQYAPFPSSFIIHEMRVRGHNPFQPIQPDIPDNIVWQEWVTSDMVDSQGQFNRDRPGQPYNTRSQQEPQAQQRTARPSSGVHKLPALNDDVIAEILAAQRALPTWKACEIEGTSWVGTAEENTQKYISSIGVEDEDDVHS